MQNIELLFEAKETMVFLFPFEVTLARKMVQVWLTDTATWHEKSHIWKYSHDREQISLQFVTLE